MARQDGSPPRGPKAAYREKLMDPRWQKRRLQVLERDGWTCGVCGDTETTLHVHHRWYEGGDPWDAPDEALVTMCKECHEEDPYNRAAAMAVLERVLRVRWTHEIDNLATMIATMPTEIRDALFACESHPAAYAHTANWMMEQWTEHCDRVQKRGRTV